MAVWLDVEVGGVSDLWEAVLFFPRFLSAIIAWNSACD